MKGIHVMVGFNKQGKDAALIVLPCVGAELELYPQHILVRRQGDLLSWLPQETKLAYGDIYDIIIGESTDSFGQLHIERLSGTPLVLLYQRIYDHDVDTLIFIIRQRANNPDSLLAFSG